jgi:hypothetical protein
MMRTDAGGRAATAALGSRGGRQAWEEDAVKAIWDQIWLAVRAAARMLRHPRAQALATAAVLYVALGVGFYWWQEDWSLAESFYFSIVALTTVGFGDLHPTTTFTQLFTAVYLIVGLGILGSMVHAVMQHAAGRLSVLDREHAGSDSPRPGYVVGGFESRPARAGPARRGVFDKVPSRPSNCRPSPRRLLPHKEGVGGSRPSAPTPRCRNDNVQLRFAR